MWTIISQTNPKTTHVFINVYNIQSVGPLRGVHTSIGQKAVGISTTSGGRIERCRLNISEKCSDVETKKSNNLTGP